MHEKHFIDELLFGEKNDRLACTNQVEDNFIVAEKEGEEEKNQKALLEEKNENSKNCFDILMNVFECADYITDTKFESMDIEDEDSEVEEIFMKWSPEEIKFYYELKLQESIEQDIDDCIQKWEHHIYVELEAFVNIKDKCSQEYAKALRTKNHNQKSNFKMSKNKVKRVVKQNRVKMKHIWSSKSRKKLHLHHYLTSRKVKMKLLICKPS